jgi:hypothetical protein
VSAVRSTRKRIEKVYIKRMGNNNSSSSSSPSTTPRNGSRRLLLNALTGGQPQPHTREGRRSNHASAAPALAAAISIPTLYIDGGQSSAFGNLYSGDVDYELNIIQKAIMERKLAPFYNLTEDDETIGEQLSSGLDHQGIGKKKHTVEQILGDLSMSVRNDSNPLSLEAYPLQECPICFMVMPLKSDG